MLFSSRLHALRSSKNHTVLDFHPQDLTVLEIIQVILVFATRQLLAASGFGNRFEVRKGSTNGNAYLLPDIHLSMPFRIAQYDLDVYTQAVGCQKDEAARLFQDPRQACFMLSAFSEPAFLLLLAHHQSPVRPLGAVNVRNRFELLRPDLCSVERLMCKRHLYETRAHLIPETCKVKRGLEVNVEVEIVCLQENVVIFRQIFTMLQFMKLPAGQVSALKPDDVVSYDGLWVSGTSLGEVDIGRDLTMKWCQVCKDYNVIHTSALAAMAFGFPGRLLHGNHAMAFGLQGSDVWPRGVRDAVYQMEVQFRRPIVMPSRMSTEVMSKHEHIQMFRIMKGGKVYVTGSLQKLEREVKK